MDLVGDMLLERWDHASFDVDRSPTRIVRTAHRVPRMVGRVLASTSIGFSLVWSRILFRTGPRPNATHSTVVDHTYAQVANVLPADRTGVFCHDIDAFRPLLEPGRAWAGSVRVLARGALRGMRRAAIVFHSTRAVRAQLVSNELVHERKLVHAPYGVSQEFLDGGSASQSADETRIGEALGPARDPAFCTGSGIAGKRLDVLFEVLPAARRRRISIW